MTSPLNLGELERLRDQFAMAALNGVIRNGTAGPAHTATRVYKIADAMIEARAVLPAPPDGGSDD